MDTLRQRLPFRFSDDHLGIPDGDNRILDEQEQEEIVQRLRQANTASSRLYLNLLRVVLSLSLFLQFLSLLDSSHGNPLLAIIPSTIQDPIPPIPLPAIFSFISLLLHVNLYLVASPDVMKNDVRLQVAGIDLRPLSYTLCYALAAVAPTLSMFLRRTWQSSVWWGLTVAVIFIVQTVTEAIAHGNTSISGLETMRYVAHGA